MLSKHTHLSRKTLAIIFSLILVSTIASSVVTYVVAQSSLTAPTISGGPYPGASDYNIFEDNGVYCAKNSYGSIVFTSTNASILFQQTISTMTSGQTLLISNGLYSVSGLSLNNKVGITIQGESESSTILQMPANTVGNIMGTLTPGIATAELSTTKGYCENITIRDLTFDGNIANQVFQNTFWRGYYAPLQLDNVNTKNDLFLSNIHVINSISSGISIMRWNNVHLNNIQVDNGGTWLSVPSLPAIPSDGIYIGSQDTLPQTFDVTITNYIANYCSDTGLVFEQVQGVAVSSFSINHCNDGIAVSAIGASSANNTQNINIGVGSMYGNYAGISFFRSSIISGFSPNLITIQGVTVTGTSNNAGSQAIGGFGANFVSISNTILNTWKNGVFFNNSYNLMLTGNTFINCEVGIYYVTGDAWVINGNMFNTIGSPIFGSVPSNVTTGNLGYP